MQKQFQSVALIPQIHEAQTKFLLTWQALRSQWEFIVADRLNNESFRESIAREVAWQLGLNRKSEFLASNMAQLSMEDVESRPSEPEQHVAVAFYNVHIYGKAVRETLTTNSDARWLSAREVCNGETVEGQRIHPRVVNWINKWQVVRPWQ